MLEDFKSISKIKNIVLSAYLSIFLVSSFASANTCKLFYLGDKVQSIGRNYTAPRSHTENEELANNVVAAHENRNFGLNSVWYEFIHDPRYNGPMEPGEPVLMAAESINAGRIRRKPVELDYYYGVKARDPDSRYFVTWKRIGIRAVNRLVSNRIKFAGFFDGYADGRHFTKRQFLQHDLSHAYSTHESTSVYPFDIKLFDKVRYESIVESLSENDRVLFDIGYFLFYFERIANGLHFNEIDLNNLTLERVQSIYAHLIDSYTSGIGIVFENGHPKAEVIKERKLPLVYIQPSFEKKFRLVNRFLNKKDLYGLLPRQVKFEIRNQPSDQDIVGDFVEKSLTLFLQKHYEAVLDLLEINTGSQSTL
jgi:hypothetical protein